MNPFTTLIKRELWENQSIFLYVPIGISLFMIALLLLSLFVMNVEIGGDVHVSSSVNQDRHEYSLTSGNDGTDGLPIRTLVMGKIKQLADADPEERTIKVNGALKLINSPLRLILVLVLVYYLIGCLYEERKNRTILFWKSMPISDSATVGSKLVAALVLTPAIFFGCMLLMDICALMMASILAAMAEVPVWDVLWSGAIGYWLSLPMLFVFYVCWALPIIGWILFVSAFARSIPLMWALGIPIGIIIAELILFGSGVFRDFVMHHASIDLGLQTVEGFLDAQSVYAQTMQLDMLVGLLIGIVFIVGSIWKRGTSDET